MKIQAIDWENKSHTGPRNVSHYIKKPQKPYFQKKKTGKRLRHSFTK